MSLRSILAPAVTLAAVAVPIPAESHAQVVTGPPASGPAAAPSGEASAPSAGGTAEVPAAVAPGWGRWRYPFYPGPYGWYGYAPSPTIIVVQPTVVPRFPVDPVGQAGAAPMPAAEPPAARVPAPLPRPRRGDSARSERMVTLGDRFFRAGNTYRAGERYQQALDADPGAAAPRIRLAQLALLKGNYAESANRIREALMAEPGWLATAPDIQQIYGEPDDFHAPLAKLEAHLQARPDDRDAWLVLGAQWYLSGRTRSAADVFLRLSDRRGDPALSAFLAATEPGAGP